jgi:hypothetical protein
LLFRVRRAFPSSRAVWRTYRQQISTKAASEQHETGQQGVPPSSPPPPFGQRKTSVLSEFVPVAIKEYDSYIESAKAAIENIEASMEVSE